MIATIITADPILNACLLTFAATGLQLIACWQAVIPFQHC